MPPPCTARRTCSCARRPRCRAGAIGGSSHAPALCPPPFRQGHGPHPCLMCPHPMRTLDALLSARLDIASPGAAHVRSRPFPNSRVPAAPLTHDGGPSMHGRAPVACAPAVRPCRRHGPSPPPLVCASGFEGPVAHFHGMLAALAAAPACARQQRLPSRIARRAEEGRAAAECREMCNQRRIPPFLQADAAGWCSAVPTSFSVHVGAIGA
jgi:hypothetical protein